MFYVRRVVGVSMKPTIEHGRAVVFLKRRTYKAGDVVLATQADREVIKRIKKIYGGKVWLKGDNSLESTDSDELGPIKMKNIKAKLLLKL
jgi:phage repressor protein C with HTH and peptisase S24 domain